MARGQDDVSRTAAGGPDRPLARHHGRGGSILTVPIFVYVLGFRAKEAIASSLAVVGVTSLFGALEHWREGSVKLRVALVFGVFAMVGAYLGSQLAAFISGAAQLVLFAVVMLGAAFFMLREGNHLVSEAIARVPSTPANATLFPAAASLAVLQTAWTLDVVVPSVQPPT